jgi:hypothetical protein
MMKFLHLHTYCFPLLTPFCSVMGVQSSAHSPVASRLLFGLYPVMVVTAHYWKWAQKCLPLAHHHRAASVDNFHAVINCADAYLLSNASITRNPALALKIPVNVQNLSTIRIFHNGRYVK